MLAVGDLRNRLMALADESALGNIEMYALFAHRFSPDATQAALLEELQTLIDGIHPLTVEIPEPLRLLACQYLQIFYREMPETFDLRGASIGNLILAGGYLAHNRNIDTVIFLFSQLANVRGRVQPIVDVDVHLAALLEDGTEIVGQHLLTGKEFAPPASPVARLRLVDDLEDPKPITAEILPKVKKLIAKAEVICFPIGSFYSSVLANILPRGVGRQIRKVVCPKVYVPNLGVDPEQVGMTLSRSVATLIAYLRKDAGADTPTKELLHFVFVDTKRGDYSMPLDIEETEALGVRVLDVSLVKAEQPDEIDPGLLAALLLSLA